MMLKQFEPIETLAPALFGQVHKCRDVATGACVAVKRMELAYAARGRTLSSGRAVDEDVLTELQVNLKVKALGGHAHVLPALDCVVQDQAAFLVTKFCARGELLAVVNADRPALATADLLRYFAQVVRGAAFLHANGIAHRDLSLENVLVDEQDCCQISDFGLATLSPRLEPRPVGKMLYMAPEVCEHDDGDTDAGELYDPTKADVWSLGVMLFAMLAGQYPFQEPLRRDARFRLLEDLGVDYLLAKCDVDTHGKEAIVDLLRQMLTVDPSQRSPLSALLSHEALRWKADDETDVGAAYPRDSAKTATSTGSALSGKPDTERCDVLGVSSWRADESSHCIFRKAVA